mgnify:CR=1 FL=1
MKLYIDDLRNPPDNTWTVARTSAAAIKTLAEQPRLPETISFDHDLGGDDTAVGVVN